jgi:hypothetical protein
MYPISPAYTQSLLRRDRTWELRVNIDGTDYTKSQVIDFQIENSLVAENDFEIGTAIVSKLILSMRFNETIPPNARVVPYLGLSLNNVRWIDVNDAWQDYDVPWIGGQTESIPLGEFFVGNREQVGNVWVYTCYDKLMFANVAYISSLTYPATMKAVWDEICGRLGYTYDSTVQINPTYMIQAGPAGYSMRQVLGYIAGANSASVFVGKDGTIKWRRFSGSEKPAFRMSKSDYIRLVQTNPKRTLSKVVVTYNTEDELTYEAGNGNDNQTLYYENPFMTQQMVDDLQATLNGFSYIPVQMDARGYPQIEAGDRIRFGTPVTPLTWGGAAVKWGGADFTWDAYQGGGGVTIALHTVFSFKGGLKMSIEAMSKSEQQSEFQVDGTLTAAVQALNKTAVKEGKSYYGATLTRTEGLTIEREDHASKVILNSDEMSFWADGQRAIWFDIWSRRYKFTGTLEASEIIGGTVIGGTIEGGTITGSEVNGGTITGSLVRTSASFPRTEMDVEGNLLAAYSSESQFVKIVPFIGSPVISISDSIVSGQLGTLLATLTLQSDKDLLLSATGGTASLRGSGNVAVGSTGGDISLTGNAIYANGVPINSTLSSLQSQINSLNSRVSALESA